MDFKEASTFLKFDKTTHEIRSVSETANYFIFSIVPIHAKGAGPFKAATSVDKRTGATAIFNPMRVDRAELKTLKQVWPNPQ